MRNLGCLNFKSVEGKYKIENSTNSKRRQERNKDGKEAQKAQKKKEKVQNKMGKINPNRLVLLHCGETDNLKSSPYKILDSGENRLVNSSLSCTI